jgi:hypothetical protein
LIISNHAPESGADRAFKRLQFFCNHSGHQSLTRYQADRRHHRRARTVSGRRSKGLRRLLHLRLYRLGRRPGQGELLRNLLRLLSPGALDKLKRWQVTPCYRLAMA